MYLFYIFLYFFSFVFSNDIEDKVSLLDFTEKKTSELFKKKDFNSDINDFLKTYDKLSVLFKNDKKELNDGFIFNSINKDKINFDYRDIYLSDIFKIYKKYYKEDLNSLNENDKKKIEKFILFKELIESDIKKIEKAVELSKNTEFGLKNLNEIIFKRNEPYIKYLKYRITKETYEEIIKKTENIKKDFDFKIKLKKNNEILDYENDKIFESEKNNFSYESKLEKEYVDSVNYKNSFLEKLMSVNDFLFLNLFCNPDCTKEKTNPLSLIGKNKKNFKKSDYIKIEKSYINLLKIFKAEDNENFEEKNKESFLYKDLIFSSIFDKNDNLFKINEKIFGDFKLNEFLKNNIYKDLIISYYFDLYKKNKINDIYKKEKNYATYEKKISEIITTENEKFFKFISSSKNRIEKFSNKSIEKEKNYLLEATKNYCLINGMSLDKDSLKNLEEDLLKNNNFFVNRNKEKIFLFKGVIEFISEKTNFDIFFLENKINNFIKNNKILLEIDKNFDDLVYSKDGEDSKFRSLYLKYKKKSIEKDDFLNHVDNVFSSIYKDKKLTDQDKNEIMSLLDLKFDLKVFKFFKENTIEIVKDKIKVLNEDLKNQAVNEEKNKEALEGSMNGIFKNLGISIFGNFVTNIISRISSFDETSRFKIISSIFKLFLPQMSNNLK